MKRYSVKGMSCAACSARVEKAVSGVTGVTVCNVNLLTNSMEVDGSASDDDIISAVRKAGYDASSENNEKEVKENPVKKLINRLIPSVILLLILMYLSMGYTMLNFPIPSFLENNLIFLGITQLIIALSVLIINRAFFINGLKAVLHKAPNMDTLVSLGSSVAFIYSAYSVFMMIYTKTPEHYFHNLYFESSAMIPTLTTIGKILETYSKGKTTNAIKSLIELVPDTATVIRDNVEVIIPANEMQIDDIFIVKPGERIPADGIIIEGDSAINESAITGESIPKDKSIGDTVFTATINQSGFLKCRATKVGNDTSLAQIIKMVSDASSGKAPIAKIADKVSGIFVPTVIVLALIATVVWLILGKPIGYALAKGIAVLVVSCPCALGLATPVAIMVGSGVGAKNNILFKTATSLELTGKCNIVVFDKTGTITKGEPSVTDILPSESVSENELLAIAKSIEQRSEHPLAKAIIDFSKDKNIPDIKITDFEAIPGKGLFAKTENIPIYAGNYKYISDKIDLSDEIKNKLEQLALSGKTPLLFVKGDKLLGIIAISDTIKDDSKEAVEELKQMGIKVVMLTGDNQQTANAVGEQISADKIIADVLPNGKETVIRKLKESGKVIMVGDGINDAPALTSADIGIAISSGTDIAIDSADVVLAGGSLKGVSGAIKLSKATLRNIYENLFWAFGYNIIGIPLAAGVFIPLFGWELNPMFGAAAMSVSSFLVVSNALRLNFVKLHNNKKEKIITMKKTIKIEGMMCKHCEARVKSTLENLDGVEFADVSHEKGTAVITTNKDISNDIIVNAITAQGYKVIGIE